MRFLERTFSALRYHRAAYLTEFIASLLLCAVSILMLTVRAQGLGMRQNFGDRLAQFTPSAVTKAGQLIGGVQRAYSQLDSQLLWAWGLLIGATALVSFLFALLFARRRRQESLAYLMVGKSTGAILAQYLLESLIVAGAGFLAVWLLCLLFGANAAGWLSQLTRAGFSDQLQGTLATGTISRDLTTLMHSHVTTFSGPGLLVPNQAPGARPALALSGEGWTLVAIVGAVALGQASAWLLHLGRLRWHLRRSQP
ncbi:hypothetical protein [Lacticaseibacillus suihuaensis]